MGKFYITTTIPYVNAAPHVGFGLEIVQADVLARFKSLGGEEVFFNTGVDEHGLKIYRKSIEQKKEAQEFCDEHAVKYDSLKKTLNLNYNHFIRTTDKYHQEAAREFWRRCEAKGDIYKKNYKIKYCVGCELEKTESELAEGRCPVHPNLEVELIEEENYFFRFSEYRDKLLALYDKNPDFVLPDFRFKEIRNFVEKGLEDFSISRLKSKLPWGVEVPGDSEQVMYVWFDALINYISALGWPKDEKKFNDYWPGVQVAGKDNLRQQTAMWQAMLMSAGLVNSKQILIHGFITSGGEKISKSLGNLIDPFEVVAKYGTDAVRYFLLAKIPPFQDGAFTIERLEKAYQADLANGLGNLVARVAAMAGKMEVEIREAELIISKGIGEKIEAGEFDKALEIVWKQIKKADRLISEKEVWKLEGEEKKQILAGLGEKVRQIGVDLQPFLPETAEKILKQFGKGKIKRGENLFERLKDQNRVSGDGG